VFYPKGQPERLGSTKTYGKGGNWFSQSVGCWHYCPLPATIECAGFQRPFGQVWSGERKPVEIHVLRHGYNQSLAYYWKVQSVGSALSLPILFMNGLLTNTDATGALGNYIPLTNRQLDAFQL
jgi:hypothetical protein